MFMRKNIASYTHFADAKKRADSEAQHFIDNVMEDSQRTEKSESPESQFPYRVSCVDFTAEAGRLTDCFVVQKIAHDEPFIEIIGWNNVGDQQG